jgi:nucleoside-diphosphate-sugar epimerase
VTEEAVLLTGATGALGPQLVAELLAEPRVERVVALVREDREPAAQRLAALRQQVGRLAEAAPGRPAPSLERLEAVAGDVSQPGLGMAPETAHRLAREVGTVIHAAADTRFTAPREELWRANAEAVEHLAEWARGCPGLRRLVVLSTGCVAGRSSGSIPEELLPHPDAFVNSYEETKWHGERIAAGSGLPVVIVRLTTAAGSRTTGRAERLGAFHQLLAWCARGLMPMIPVDPEAPVDLISNELAAGTVARLLAQSPESAPRVIHVAAGPAAPTARQLLDLVTDELRQVRESWRRGQVEPPMLVGEATFARFRAMVERSGNPLFTRIVAAADSFLPSLCYPRRFETRGLEALWDGAPEREWEELVRGAVRQAVSASWAAPAEAEAAG